MYWTVDDAVGIYSIAVLVRARLTGGYESARAAEMWPHLPHLGSPFRSRCQSSAHLIFYPNSPPKLTVVLRDKRENSYDSAAVSLSSQTTEQSLLSFHFLRVHGAWA
ncbi:hypothetical protein PanWU01x14_131120 [Parasponia andersonii]|uniref:Uncharacterized protein n=1 Tax=Parasponia andersonii TaxID=3476 RepID=A0A2P5CQW9_PARAD|nr:hypothetical protein PanWU01x14_131120 [Parasponia andersonii]